MIRNGRVGGCFVLWLAGLPTVALPQVVRDGTIGPSALVQPVGPAYVIPQDMGTLAGSNLFHSFSEFSLAQGQSATFTGDLGIDNVIARVTGTDASLIDGALRSRIPGADFWLLNPHGVMFGQHASLDLDGSLNISTADSLDFDDGTELSAQPDIPPVLSVAAPTAFGLLGGAPGRIDVDGAVLRDAAGFSLRSGVIEISGGGALAASTTTEDRGGDIGLFASERISLIDSPPMAAANVTSTLDSSALGAGNGGDIRLEAPVVELTDGGSISSATAGSGAGGEIAIVATERLSLSGMSPVSEKSSQIVAANSSTGTGGNVYISTPLLEAEDAAGIWNTSSGPGAGGSITIEAARIEAVESSEIATVTNGSGRGGDVAITATEEISLGGHSTEVETPFGASIGARSGRYATGAGGSVTIEAPAIVLVDGARIDAGSHGAGSGGDVLIEADDVTISGHGDTYPSFVAASGIGSGDAGNLVMHTGRLLLENGGTIVSSAFGTGRAGDVVIVATEGVTVTGSGGDRLPPPHDYGEPGWLIDPIFRSAIIANARDAPAAGDIEITAPSVTIADGGNVSSITVASAHGGTILITADALMLDGAVSDERTVTEITADSGFDRDGFRDATGNAGAITLNVGSVELTDGASITSSSLGTGDAGSITIDASDSVRVAGDSTITTEAQGTAGDAGEITLTAGEIELTDGASISSSSLGAGNAGSVRIVAQGSVRVADDSTIATESHGAGNAGEITLTAGTLELTDGASISSSSLDTGDAGSITIEAQDSVRVADDSAIASEAQGTSGDAGEITLTSGTLELTDSARIGSSSFGTGNAGSIRIEARDSVRVADDSAIATEAQGTSGDAGEITLTAGTLELTDSARIGSSSFGTGDAGSIRIEARDSVRIAGDSVIATEAQGTSGNAGEITLTAGTLELSDGARIGSSSLGTGDAGSIRIDASDSVRIASNSNIATESQGASGNAGEITLTAGALELTDGARISSSSLGAGDAGSVRIEAQDSVRVAGDSTIATESHGAGNAGEITLTAGTVELTDGARISSSSLETGDAGSIRIEAQDSVRVAGDSAIATEAQGTRGDAGEITLTAGALELTDGARISSSSLGAGDAGSVRIEAQDSVRITGDSAIATEAQGTSGNAGEITLTAGTLELTDGAQIGSSSLGTGDAGSVRIEASDSVQVANHSTITTEAQGAGNAGEITLKTGTLELTDGARISSSSLGDGNAGSIHIDESDSVRVAGDSTIATEAHGAGNAGEITLKTGTLELTDGARISSSSFDTGNAGSIRVDASDGVLVTDKSAITTEARGTSGNAGEIALTADRLELSDGGRISSSSLGAGNAGNIHIAARQGVYIDRGTIATEAKQASGGNISLSAGEELWVHNGEISASVMRGNGSGGNVTIGADRAHGITRPDRIVLDGARITAKADAGSGGNINIRSNVFLASGTTMLDASAATGIDGNVRVEALGVAGEPRVENLAVSYVDATSLLREQCVARDSHFVVRSRRGQPASPEEMLLAFDAVDRSVTPDVAQVASASGTGSLLDGQLMLRGGRDEDAAALFRGAAHSAVAAGDAAAEADALRGLGQSLQAQGLYVDSLAPLSSALAIAEGIEDRGRAAAALVNLGNAQLALGNNAVADDLLTRAVVLAQQLDDAPLQATAANAIGNKYVSTADFETALASFEESATLARRAGDPYLVLRALANAARAALLAAKPDRAQALMEEARASVYPLPATPEKVQLLVHLGRSHAELAKASPELREQSLLAAFEALSTAEALARSMPDQQRALSFALGNLAALYEQEQRVPEALYLNTQALAAAEDSGAIDAAYRWDWQEGRLQWARGEPDAAIKAYRRAVDLVEETRQGGQARYGATSGHFREAIAPVYLDLVDALLRASDMISDPSQAGLLLEEARQTMEQLKAAELRDYFRDECAAESQDVFQSHWPATAVVYPIVLADRLELLVSLPDGIERYRVAVSSVDLTREVHTFRQQLEERASPRHYRPTAKRLYDWLVAPYAASLAAAGVETLVFVPDGALRSIPMSALYDGEDFIVARYATVTAASLALVDLQPLPSLSHALLAGLSESVAGFPGLPNVPGELGSIRAAFGGKLLLDADFTRARFESAMAERQPAIVHIASHAQFTGDPATSFLLTHDGALSMSELEQSVSARSIPLELLVLSACQTAAGDDRAALGLAGESLRAGARSAVGSLWNVSDAATALLFEDFYARLREPGTSRAAAMRAAQQALLDSDRFNHPYFWSGFLLINSWL